MCKTLKIINIYQIKQFKINILINLISRGNLISIEYRNALNELNKKLSFIVINT